MEKCKSCDGCGRQAGEWSPTQDPCDDCGGSGEVPRAAAAPTIRNGSAGDVWREAAGIEWTVAEPRASGLSWWCWRMVGLTRMYRRRERACFTDGTLTFVRSAPEPTTAQSPENRNDLQRAFDTGWEAARAEAGLTFGAFGRANRERCESPDGFARQLNEWNVVHWALAVSGEAGELAGAALAAGYQPWKGKTDADVLDEVADVVAYCDLLAQRMGTTLEAVVARKWNRVSAKRGYSVRLSWSEWCEGCMAENARYQPGHCPCCSLVALPSAQPTTKEG